jgi:hypothetical protein
MSRPTIFWSQLAKLNAVKFINTMYVWIFIVPVLAKLLENMGDKAQLTIFEHTFVAHLTLPFSWVCFYFSALAFASANLVFQARCPNIIKEQSGYSEFRRLNKGVEHLDSYLPEIGMNWEGLRQDIERRDEYFSEIAEALNPEAEDGLLRKRFWVAYFHGDRCRHVWKLLAFVLYTIGLMLILIVLSQNALFVTKYLLGF